jgi:cardiolipin synthase
VIEDAAFAQQMEEAYLADLANATELVLDARTKVRPSAGDGARAASLARHRGRGSGGRAAAGAMRISNALGAAFADRRVLEPVESRLLLASGALLLALAALFAFFPRLLAVPLTLALAWGALALIHRGLALHRARGESRDARRDETRPPGL